MNPSEPPTSRSLRLPGWCRRAGVPAGAVVLALCLVGCSSQSAGRGFLPADSVGATDHTGRIQDLWVGSWVAALLLGVLVWGLILWCVVAYRRRCADDPMPTQFRYNVPIEVMYTAVPLVVVLVLFYFTARDQAEVLDLGAPGDDVEQIEVIGKQWAWDFNYRDQDAYSTGRQAELDAPGEVESRISTLYLPVDREVVFTLHSRDVNHSFWIPAFLFKMDTIAGRTNQFRVTPTEVGTFDGRCAELCGENHAEMLFNVVVLPQDEYEQQMAELRAAGQTGALDVELGRSGVNPAEVGGGVRGTGADDSSGSEGTDG